MNVVHCNECGGTEEVSSVVLHATRLVDADPTGTLAKPERVSAEGDLCATCLKTVTGMIVPDGIGSTPADLRVLP